MAQPKRLPGISYTGFAVYFVTTVTIDRVKAFSRLEFGRIAEQLLFEIALKEGFAVSAYCLMPDHVHLLLTATREDSNLRTMVSGWKQRTGFTWSRSHSRRLWQHGYWDRVLRDGEDALSIARYVIENPVRAGLAAQAADYPLAGSTEYTMDEINGAIQMKYWWRD